MTVRMWSCILFPAACLSWFFMWIAAPYRYYDDGYRVYRDYSAQMGLEASAFCVVVCVVLGWIAYQDEDDLYRWVRRTCLIVSSFFGATALIRAIWVAWVMWSH